MNQKQIEFFAGKILTPAPVEIPIQYSTIVIWILQATFSVLLLVLAGALIALYFHGVSSLVQRRLHMTRTYGTLVSTLGSFALLVVFFWFAGDRIQQQAEESSKALPSAFNELKNR